MILAPGSRLVLATHNPGKARELATLLAPYRLATVAAGELGLPEPEETGATFLANAGLKASAAARESGLPALADDSGLEVDALEGAPGVRSARWAGPGRDFGVAIERVRDAIAQSGARPPWRARFVCVLALALPDGDTRSWSGTVAGECIWPARGTRGFGYDPIFLPDGSRETFGEMDPAAKDAVSHRGQAFAALARALPLAKES